MKATSSDMAQSARLAYRNLLFLSKNPRFGIVPATIYLMTAWQVGATAGGEAPSNPWRALRVKVDAFSSHPALALWCGGIVLGLLAFTDTHSRIYRVVGGVLHSGAHVSAMFYIGWGALDMATRSVHASGVMHSAVAGAGTFVGGWIAGSLPPAARGP